MTTLRRIISLFHGLKPLTAPILALSVVACGGGTGAGTPPSPPTYGTLSVALTNTSPDGATDLVLHVTKASTYWLRPAVGGNGAANVKINEFDIVDPVSGDPGYDVHLTQFTGNKTVSLFTKTVLAIDYNAVTLTVDWSQSYIEFDGAQYKLNCPDCNGYSNNKNINSIILGGGKFNVGTNQAVKAVGYFDLRQNIYKPSDTTNPNLPYKFVPAVRVTHPGESAQIHGTVDRSLRIDSNDTGTPPTDGCYIYVYTRQDDTSVNDVPSNILWPSPAGHVNPVKTILIDKNPLMGNTDAFPYIVPFLPAGDYTLAVTCDGPVDDPSLNEDGVDTTLPTVGFSYSTNISVLPGEDVELNLPVS